MMLNRQRTQAGITLIEILVTMIILAIGFLGLASVQLLGTRNISNSNYRTLATIYAYDMAERMRANQVGVNLGSYNAVISSSATDPACSSYCTPAQMADRDASEWDDLLTADPVNGGLPNGAGSVAYDATDDVFTIAIRWTENVREGDIGQLQNQTYSLLVKM
ncbi:type IV pilus modification protein PilV [Halioxenophilus sp. WMMB6]|uniref:type IV pilus modification protein PilV n=1 Tax=Halioxenophilus sp. WMMB6 TaxID=3073815 RepID=UPI00295E97C8|nr:type IV pilus modification protein PilV [Halioxenophilus sp. WMMB6]